MPKYSRRGFLAMGGSVMAALSGCSQDTISRESSGNQDSLGDVIHEIEYRQRQRVGEFNDYFGDEIFNEDSLDLSHHPADLENSTSDIDYQVSLHTDEEYSIDEIRDLDPENNYSPLEEVAGRLIFESLHVPLKGIRGKAFVDEEASRQYKKRLGDINIALEDSKGTKESITVPDEKANEFWHKIDQALEKDEKDMKIKVAREIRDYTADRL